MPLYKQKGSEFWWIALSHQGRRVRRSSRTTDRQEAKRIEDELKVELWKTTPAIKGLTWGKAVKHWCAKEERSASELLSLAKFGRLYPDRLLTRVDRESVDRALNKFCSSAGTYTRYRTMIAAILNAAKEEGWLREVPKLATRKDKKPVTRTWLTAEQWEKLLAELPKHMKPMASFAIETGLRQANVLGLTWDRVDLERKVVWVEGEDTKSGNAIAVPLSKGAVDVLKTVQGQHDVFVFTFRGKPIKEIKTAFLAACCRAGVGSYADDARTGRAGYSGFTWHGLRHTWATWHIQNGTPLDVLQKLGGWSDLRMVMKYAHHAPGYLASFADNARKKNEAQ